MKSKLPLHAINDEATQRALRQIDQRLNEAADEITELKSHPVGSGVTLPIEETDVTGLVADLASKSDVGHTHPESDVTGLVSDLAGKAPLIHTHVVADITDLDVFTDTTDGLVPAPNNGSLGYFLRDDATWADPSGIVTSPYYGPGTDGPLTFDGTTPVVSTAFSVTMTLTPSSMIYTLVRDIYASSIAVNSGVTIISAGYRIFCTGQLTNNGTIHNNGSNGIAPTGGLAAPSGTIPGGGSNGANGSTGSASGSSSSASTACPPNPWTTSQTAAAGGSSGTSAGTAGKDRFQGGGGGGITVTNPPSAPSTGSGGNGGALTAFGLTQPFDILTLLLGANLHTTPSLFSLGTGGGSGAVSILSGGFGPGGGAGPGTNPVGGGGGGSAGALYIGARIIAGTGVISANGGHGGNGNNNGGEGGASGGAGGGGGLVTIVYSSRTGTQTITATGGAGGTGVSGTSFNFLGATVTYTAENGAAGADGWVFAYLQTGGGGSGGGGGLTDADYGDVTISGAGSIITIDAGAVTSSKIATGAVTSTKIAAGAVTTTELGALAVTTAKIAAANVTATELAANAVTTTKIADDNVTMAKIEDAAGARVIGALSAGSPSYLTGTQVTTVLDVATITTKGLVSALPNDATKYWDGTGNYSVPAGGGGGGASLPTSGVSVYNSASLTANTGTTKLLTFDSEVYDTSSFHSTVSNTSRLIAPVTGYYLVSAACEFQSNASGYRHLEVGKNGAGNPATWATVCFTRVPPSSSVTDIQTSAVVQMNANDYVEVAALQNSGSNLAVSTTDYLPFQLTLIAAASPTFSGCSVYNTTNQSVAHATATAITWNSELFDTASYHSVVSNTSRLVAPTAGYYEITASVEFATNATGERYLKIQKNGVATDYAFDTQHGQTTYQTSLECTCTLLLAAGDYVEAVVYQDSGGSLNVVGTTYHPFQMKLLGT